MARSHVGLGGYSAYSDARIHLKKNRIPQARRRLKDAIKSIGKSYETAVLAKRKPGITKEQKQKLDDKIKKLRELQTWVIDDAKRNGIKL